MTPREYEQLVAAHFKGLGYDVELTPQTNDYGVDAFASRGPEKVAVQAKMYGDTARKINREMVMQLYGAKDYFDCTRAVIVTNGELHANATKVAEKLGVEVLFLRTESPSSNSIGLYDRGDLNSRFDEIWQSYIMPLQGKTLERNNGRVNKVIRVDWGGLERETSNGRFSKIPIEAFRFAVKQILSVGHVTRDAINQEYAKLKASSGVVLILSQVPLFEHTTHPEGLRRKSEP